MISGALLSIVPAYGLDERPAMQGMIAVSVLSPSRFYPRYGWALEPFHTFGVKVPCFLLYRKSLGPYRLDERPAMQGMFAVRLSSPQHNAIEIK